MPPRADAHIHLFDGGYRGSFPGRPGVTFDEAALYDSLARQHTVEAALVVAHEGQPWAAGNTGFVCELARNYAWVRPVASADPKKPPTLKGLEDLRRAGAVGLSFYIFDPADAKALRLIPHDLWAWMAEHRWLVSLNSRGPLLESWQMILSHCPQLRLIVSHLGLPPAAAQPPDPGTASRSLKELTALAAFPHTAVKLSGFYALTQPAYDYPHRAAWPYVQALIESFTTSRLMWGSDFTPCLDHLSFPQTYGLFATMPFLSDDDRKKIEGENLLRWLA